MPKQCAVNPQHEFESRSGALKLFHDGEISGDWVCPGCVEDIQDDKIHDYRIFVIEGVEVVIPLDEIDT